MTIELKFTISEEEAEKFGEQIVDIVVGEIEKEIKKSIRELNVVATGEMLRSVHKRGNSVIVDVPYASYVEYGTRPHRPPKRAIFEWAKTKFKLSDKDAWRLTNYVVKKITEYGTKPKPFVRRAIYRVMFKKEVLGNE